MKKIKAIDLLKRVHRLFLSLRRRGAEKVESFPAVASLVAVLGLLILHFCCGFSLFAGVAAIAAPLLLLLPFGCFCRFLLPSFAAILISLYLADQADRKRSFPDRYLINRRTYGEFEVRITDPAADPLGSSVRMVRGQILRFRAAGETDWITLPHPVNAGLTNLRPSVGYGDRWIVHAMLHEPDPPLLPDVFDYRAYLRREGISFLLRQDRKEQEIFLESGRGGVRRTLYDLRSRALARITSPMGSEEAKALTGGIFFGVSRDLSPETKEDFLRSGMIHILTVSGTHVGFFALLIFLLCPFLSYRGRAGCVILVTIFYVLLTGADEPSIRALVMICCFLFAKMLRFYTKSLNTLAFAALILLIWDPQQIFATGFQFSFLVVAVLLLTGPLVPAIRRTVAPEQLLIPASQTSRFTFFLRGVETRLLNMILATVAAGVTGIALSVYYQGLFSGVSVLANFLLLPILMLAFPMAFLAVLAGGFFSRMLEKLLLLLLSVNESLAETGTLMLAKPPLWSVILLIAAIFLLFLPAMPKIVRIAAACAVLIFPFWWHIRTVTAEPELLVLHGAGENGDHNLTFVLTDPPRRSAVVLNMPDYTSAVNVSVFLKSRGIGHCRVLAAADHYVGSVEGLDVFAARNGVGAVYLFPGQMRKYDSARPRKERKDTFFLKSDLKICSERGNFIADFTEHGIRVQVQREKDGTTTLMLNGNPYKIIPALERGFLLFRVEKGGAGEITKITQNGKNGNLCLTGNGK